MTTIQDLITAIDTAIGQAAQVQTATVGSVESATRAQAQAQAIGIRGAIQSMDLVKKEVEAAVEKCAATVGHLKQARQIVQAVIDST